MSLLAHRSGRSQPPKSRAWMRTPLVPNVSFRRIASNSESREFSSAQTPTSPPGFRSGCGA